MHYLPSGRKEKNRRWDSVLLAPIIQLNGGFDDSKPPFFYTYMTQQPRRLMEVCRRDTKAPS